MIHRTPEMDRALLAEVRDCPHRGPVLPLSQQPYAAEGCARCGELSACAAGKGNTPGRVTLEDCVRCRYGAAGTPED